MGKEKIEEQTGKYKLIKIDNLDENAKKVIKAFLTELGELKKGQELILKSIAEQDKVLIEIDNKTREIFDKLEEIQEEIGNLPQE